MCQRNSMLSLTISTHNTFISYNLPDTQADQFMQLISTPLILTFHFYHFINMSQGPVHLSNGTKKPDASPLNLFQIILLSMDGTPDVSISKRTSSPDFHTWSRRSKVYIIAEPDSWLMHLQVNWDEVAAKAGYNSALTARTRYGQIKRKLQRQESGEPLTPSPTKPKSQKVTPKQNIGSGTNNSSSKIRKSTAHNGRGRAIHGTRGTSFTEKIQKGMTRGKDSGVFLRSPSFESSDMKEEIEYQDISKFFNVFCSQSSQYA